MQRKPDDVLPPDTACEFLYITDERFGVEQEIATIRVSGVHRREVAEELWRRYELHDELVEMVLQQAEFIESGGFDATPARVLLNRALRNH